MTPEPAPLPAEAARGRSAPVTQRAHSELVHCGAELVELSERFYRGVFIGAVIFVSLASAAALALLPTRNSLPSAGPPATVAIAVLLIALAPLAIWRAAPLYRLLRRQPRLELVLLALAAALLAYPLRSELWWPACGLLMLLAAIAPLRRALLYCLAALLTNLAAHIIAGDLTEAPPVAIIGLWIGLVFWTATFGLITDRLATAILRVNVPASPEIAGTMRVAAWSPSVPSNSSGDAQDPAPIEGAEEDLVTVETDPQSPMTAGTGGLTARQLQVVALLADGLRYRDIATCLSISERQVQRHVGNAIARIGVGSAGELVALAVAEGVVPGREHAGYAIDRSVIDEDG